MQRALVTGGAGFIGSNLADRLLADGVQVVMLDDLRSGNRRFCEDAIDSGAEFVEADILDTGMLRRAVEGCDIVFHLQANADVRHGLERPQVDLRQNTIATSGLLEVMREADVTNLAFSSTGSVYGEPEIFPTPEDCPLPVQTSLYGASKLAAEGLIGAYSHGFGFTATIFRFVSILGERYSHGHIFDFYNALQRDPTRLRILGDGHQTKSYLHVGDCITGVLSGVEATEEGAFEVFNLGTDETVEVNDSVAVITEFLGIDPLLEYTGGTRGWAGDSPFILLDCDRIRGHGWSPELTIREGIIRTLQWLAGNDWVFEARGNES